MHFIIVNAEIDNTGNGNTSKKMADFKAVFNFVRITQVGCQVHQNPQFRVSHGFRKHSNK